MHLWNWYTCVRDCDPWHSARLALFCANVTWIKYQAGSRSVITIGWKIPSSRIKNPYMCCRLQNINSHQFSILHWGNCIDTKQKRYIMTIWNSYYLWLTWNYTHPGPLSYACVIWTPRLALKLHKTPPDCRSYVRVCGLEKTMPTWPRAFQSHKSQSTEKN